MCKHETDARTAMVAEVARLGMVEEIVKNISGRGVLSSSLLDLVQDVYIILLSYDSGKLLDIWNGGDMRYFLARVVSNQYKSATSPYYAKYKRFLSRCVPVDDQPAACVCYPCCW